MRKSFYAVLLAALLPFLTHALAADHLVAGKFFLKNDEGLIVDIMATLTHDSATNQVSLITDKGEEIAAKKMMKKLHGATVLTLVFKHPHCDPNYNYAFTGTYVRGTNKALYYGNVYRYKGALADLTTKEMANLENLLSVEYRGGFYFKADIPVIVTAPTPQQ